MKLNTNSTLVRSYPPFLYFTLF